MGREGLVLPYAVGSFMSFPSKVIGGEETDHDAVDGRVHTQRFANHTIQDRHILDILILHQTQRPILLLANIDLFLINMLLHIRSSRKV